MYRQSFLILSLITLVSITLIFRPQTTQSQLRTCKNGENCNNFDNDNACQNGTQTENPPDWINRNWQTPPKGDPLYKPSYQDKNKLVGYTQILYSADRSSAKVVFQTFINQAYYNSTVQYTIQYIFNGNAPSLSNVFYVANSNFTGKLLTAACQIIDKNSQVTAYLSVEDMDFIWNHPTVNQGPQFLNGQKGGIVEMFGWHYKDIEQECEMLGKAGYLGVKVFPPQEAVLDFQNPFQGELNPWSWIYQPVSYKLNSRHGTRQELTSMINTCRQNNVRVYADATVNDMALNGNDMNPTHCNGGDSWGAKNATAESPYYSQGYAYQLNNFTNERPGEEFPSVPYTPLDFHCQRALNSWTDPFILNNGWLVNLADLDSESEYVRQRIADYFTDLLSIGFSGFRMDAAKHISPDNLAHIFAKFKANLGGGDLPADFITYLEVIIGGEKQLLMCDDSQGYSYGTYFVNALKGQGLSDNDVYKIKIWESDYPKEFPICGYWIIPSERCVAENDCHDDQFPGSSSRDMGDQGSVLVIDKDMNKHRSFEIKLFTRTDGDWQIKLLLSSYSFQGNGYGYPDGLSDCNMCKNDQCKTACTSTVKQAQAYDPNSCGYSCFDSTGQWISGVYTRTHRSYPIILAMRQWMGLSTQVQPTDVGLPGYCQN